MKFSRNFKIGLALAGGVTALSGWWLWTQSHRGMELLPKGGASTDVEVQNAPPSVVINEAPALTWSTVPAQAAAAQETAVSERAAPLKLSKDQAAEQAIGLRAEWEAMNREMSGYPRELWELKAREFRTRNAGRLQAVAAFFKTDLQLNHPSESNPLAPPIPNSHRAPSPPAFEIQQEIIRKFTESRAALVRERAALDQNTKNLPAEERKRQIAEWESQNSERLTANRRQAVELGQLNYETVSMNTVSSSPGTTGTQPTPNTTQQHAP